MDLNLDRECSGDDDTKVLVKRSTGDLECFLVFGGDLERVFDRFRAGDSNGVDDQDGEVDFKRLGDFKTAGDLERDFDLEDTGDPKLALRPFDCKLESRECERPFGPRCRGGD